MSAKIKLVITEIEMIIKINIFFMGFNIYTYIQHC